MAGLLNPYSVFRHPESREAAKQGLIDFAKGRVAGTFAAAPDILGTTRGMSTNPMSLLPGKQFSTLVPEDFSGDPIRDVAGLDKDSKMGLLGEFFGVENAMARGVKAGTSLLKAAANSPELFTGSGVINLAQSLFHGSPHKFNIPSNAYMGTGEGAQAYGWGHYVGEAEGTGKYYQDLIPAGNVAPRRTFKGVELDAGSPQYHAGTLLEGDTTLKQAREEVSGWIREADNWPAARKAEAGEQRMLQGWRDTLETLNKADSKADFGLIAGGHLYEYDIPDEAIDKMLDWDKPLSEQPESVQRALRALPDPELKASLLSDPNKPGRMIYGELADYLGRDPQGTRDYAQLASQELNELGIPGIKYLDGTSRSAGEGTRNMVLFDPENTVRSVKRDGDEVFRKK